MVGQTERPANSNIMVAAKTFVSGGIAGCCAKTAVAPLDRVKILLQAHNVHYKHLGVFSTVKHVIHKEGFTGLYKGNGVQMMRIFPYAAIQFLTYEQLKKFAKHLPYLSHSPNTSKLICGSLAGLTSVMFTYPLDMIRSRLAFQVKGEVVYTGIKHTIQSIVLLEGGARGLYQGIVPTVLGMAPYAGLSFCSFEMLKNFALEKFPEMLGTHKASCGLVLILPAKLVCGGLAGAIAQTVSYPLDVVRRRMQLSGMALKTTEHNIVKHPRGWFQMLVSIYHENGVTRGLFRGMSVNYIRIMPTVAISFATYESCKQALGLDTSADR
ncbi:hypothetical protein EGW08_010171 [Elysia chlorotica]|uniref:Uncharacterized protein n=1 Tax=Elysia chlorotica TaxID=188477 RepID=A0A3S0ZLW5_ELYCH|nr:hypothetical protein EGW08_010171 [Elysia chlorotica]